MLNKKYGLVEATIVTDEPDEPHAIVAREDCIELHAGSSGNEEVVVLRPAHIQTIIEMHADWWERHWRARYEES